MNGSFRELVNASKTGAVSQVVLTASCVAISSTSSRNFSGPSVPTAVRGPTRRLILPGGCSEARQGVDRRLCGLSALLYCALAQIDFELGRHYETTKIELCGEEEDSLIMVVVFCDDEALISVVASVIMR